MLMPGKRMRAIVVMTLLAPCWSACNSSAQRNHAAGLTEDEKHRLYSAALATSESPVDTDTLKDVCRSIGIFDAHGQPNDQYMVFVSRHVDWAKRMETKEFRREIDSKEKARAYITKHLVAAKD